MVYFHFMKASGVVYFALSFLLVFHFLRFNNFSSDTVDYVGNVVALHVSDPVTIHDVAYRAVTTEAPAIVVPHMLGTDLSTEEALVRRAKYTDPYRFAQFLPYFSVKPLYIEALNLVHKTGVGLVRSIAVVSALSFAGIAALIYGWVVKLGGSVWAACLVPLTAEMYSHLGQVTGPDALSVLFVLGGLFSLWFVRPSVGVALLLTSVWVRPENAILSVLVLVYLAIRGELRLWMALVLLAISVVSPLAINHFGYGWKALCSHTFKLTEMDPGLFVPVFTVSDYLQAVRSGLRVVIHSSLVAYLLLCVVSWHWVPRMRWPLALCGVFSVAKFIVYPNFEPRYYAVLYLLAAIGACAAVGNPGGPVVVRDLQNLCGIPRETDTR